MSRKAKKKCQILRNVSMNPDKVIPINIILSINYNATNIPL